ncbi:hypothetical protein R1X32_11865 [Rhodococcus opacus]|uniref:hypothetical protein n=1 Tax=Rhodococcus opacus TaxID=37919 RepID=UPI0034D1A3A7
MGLERDYAGGFVEGGVDDDWDVISRWRSIRRGQVHWVDLDPAQGSEVVAVDPLLW